MKKYIAGLVLCVSLMLVPGACGPSGDSQVQDGQGGLSGIPEGESLSQEENTQYLGDGIPGDQTNGDADSQGGDASGVEDFDLAEELAGIEEQADVIQKKIQEDGSLTQTDLNVAAQELYELWDNELNAIWGRFKDILSEEEMSALMAEEREWIAYKEEAAESAASEYEGGSMTALITYQAQARLTRERVYELAVYLGEKTGQTVTKPTKDDLAGLYVDTQGTSDIYSELKLVSLGDDTYQATIGIYRLTTLEGIATANNDTLSFEDPDFKVKGEISVQGTGVSFTVTESEFTYMSPGDVFEFPERR